MSIEEYFLIRGLIKKKLLYSCDLELINHLQNNNWYYFWKFKFKNIPNLLYKWKLYTRNKTSSLTFLKENAVITFDDINHQAKEDLTKFHIFIHVIICYFLFKREKNLFDIYY